MPLDGAAASVDEKRRLKWLDQDRSLGGGGGPWPACGRRGRGCGRRVGVVVTFRDAGENSPSSAPSLSSAAAPFLAFFFGGAASLGSATSAGSGSSAFGSVAFSAFFFSLAANQVVKLEEFRAPWGRSGACDDAAAGVPRAEKQHDRCHRGRVLAATAFIRQTTNRSLIGGCAHLRKIEEWVMA